MSSIFLTKKLHFLNGENIQNKNGIDNHYQTIFRKIHNRTGYGIDIGAFPDKTNGEFSPTFLGLFY